MINLYYIASLAVAFVLITSVTSDDLHDIKKKYGASDLEAKVGLMFAGSLCIILSPIVVAAIAAKLIKGNIK